MRALPIISLLGSLLGPLLGSLLGPLLGLAALSVVPGCPSSSSSPRDGNPDDGGDGNPSVLWLATDVVETRVKLVASEPPPF
jgi:hypothetical protein